MAIQWRIVAWAVLANSCFCLFMFAIQQVELTCGKIPARHSIIAGTNQQFLHWQDFASLTYGDFLGLVLVQIAFAHLWANKLTSERQMWWFTLLMCAGMFALGLEQSRALHKPDWCYPTGTQQYTLGGYCHLWYFGMNVAIGAMCIYHWLWSTKLRGPLLFMALVGAVVWIAAMTCDVLKGRTESLNPEKETTNDSMR